MRSTEWTQVSLFPNTPGAAGAPEQPRAKATAGEIRRRRQKAAIAGGSHPLSAALSWHIPLHPDAPRGTDHTAPGPRCGTCWYRRQTHGGSRDFPKCHLERRRITHGPGTDVRAWWPACDSYSPGDPALSPDAARHHPTHPGAVTMSKPTTHVLMLIDESGSMQGLAHDVRGGFNSYLDELAADTTARYRITAAKFASGYDLLCTGVRIKDTPRLGETNYRPGGWTALLDGIGKLITDFERHTTLAEGDRVILFVQTDGHENDSREYRLDAIRKMITERQAGGRWSAVFIGAGPDAWSQAEGLGIGAGTTVAMAATSQGTADTYTGMAAATRSYATGLSGDDAASQIGPTQARRRLP